MEHGADGIEEVDVLVVGAGIAGINAGYHLKRGRPQDSFLILDALDGIGGTWWTHRFPGVRSDTEVFTLGYEWKPWTGKPYADGPEIQAYLAEAAEEQGLLPHIRLGHRITTAAWSSDEGRWTLTGVRQTDAGEQPFLIAASFVWMCHGYYRQQPGYRPTWPGMEEFEGQWIHPQAWPEGTDLHDQRVTVIGSGATAATLVPVIAHDGAQVTLLQRSPTYFVQSPNKDDLVDQLRALDTPPEWIHEIARRKAVIEMENVTRMALDFPEAVRDGLIKLVADQLPDGYDVATHFTPRHLPFEQRICRIVNGDLFAEISKGSVEMVTDEIATFTADGITTASGRHIEADVVITATGFDIVVMGDVAFVVDGEPVDFCQAVTYRGILFTGVPNMAWTHGALRLSWTMRVEMVSQYLVRLLDQLEALGATSVTPVLRPGDEEMTLRPLVDPEQFNPGYFQRGVEKVPRSGSLPEWQLSLDYWAERSVLPSLGFDDGCLVFAP